VKPIFPVGQKPKVQPDWFVAFAAELRAIADSLPSDVAQFEFDGKFVSFDLRAPTPAHRSLTLEASAEFMDYSFGKLWSEFPSPDKVSAQYILAFCDAVRAGRVREVRDRKTGLIYHIYRLTTRGLNEFARDSQFSWRFWFKPHIRQVKITRLSSLSPVGI